MLFFSLAGHHHHWSSPLKKRRKGRQQSKEFDGASSSPQLWHRYSHSYSSKSNKKVPLIYKPTTDPQNDTVTVQLLSWGRGASGQLGGGIEEIRLYPAPIATLLLPPSFRLSSPIPGCLPPPPTTAEPAVEVAVSCGLFHSGLVVDEKFWIWGKGDGGRLGLGHENPVFVPTLNPNVGGGGCVRSIALGGLHSVALNSLGQVYTW